MKRATRQVLTCALVVLYGGITLLDQGLHLLVPTGVHHHGLELVGPVAAEAHGACPCATRDVRSRCSPQDAVADESHAALRSGGCVEDSHLCGICAYLIQARSGQIQLFTAANWQPLVATVVVTTEHYQSQALLGPYAPRGPPRCCA